MNLKSITLPTLLLLCSLIAHAEEENSDDFPYNTWGSLTTICINDYEAETSKNIDAINFLDNSANIKIGENWHHIYHDYPQTIEAAKAAFILGLTVNVCYSKIDGRIFILEYES